MTMTAGMLQSLAAWATPWAWLPADAVITPACICSSESCRILLSEPRSLKEPVICRFSSFRKTSQPISSLSISARVQGVTKIEPLIRFRAASISASATNVSLSMLYPSQIGFPGNRRPSLSCGGVAIPCNRPAIMRHRVPCMDMHKCRKQRQGSFPRSFCISPFPGGADVRERPLPRNKHDALFLGKTYPQWVYIQVRFPGIFQLWQAVPRS